MGVTVSNPVNIRPTDANTLVVFKDATTNVLFVKDAYGQIERLLTGGSASPSGSGTPNSIAFWNTGTDLSDSVISQSTPYIGTGTGVVDIKGTLKQSNTLSSVYIGLNVGLNITPSATTQQYNVGIGEQALRDYQQGFLFNTETSGNNVAVGYQSMANLTIGTSNIGVGSQSLAQLSGGRQNVAIGQSSLGNLNNSSLGSESFDNIAIGDSSFISLTFGERNIGIGSQLMTSQQLGNYNVVIGGDVAQNGSDIGNNENDFTRNVILGDNALIQVNASTMISSVIIGDRSGINMSGNANRDVIIGRLAFQNNNSGGGNVAIGSNANQNRSGIVQNSITVATRSGGSGTGASSNDYGIAIGTYDDADAGEGNPINATGKYSAVIGGIGNTSQGRSGVILGGKSNSIDPVAENGAILGGFDNEIQSGGSAGMALGSNLIVNGNNQVVVGRFNTFNNNTKFIVGCGTSSAQRRNGFEVFNTGQLRARQYGSGIFPATGGYKFLVAGSTGNILEVDDSVVTASDLTVTDVTQDIGTQFFTAQNPTNAIKFDVNQTGTGGIEAFINTGFPTDGTIIFMTGSSYQSNQFLRIQPQSGVTINGQATVTLTGAYKTVQLYFDGTEYFILYQS